MSIRASFQNVARKWGVGKAILKVRHYFQLSFRERRHLEKCKAGYLPDILRARPLPCVPGKLEVHLLLQKKRLLEGMWAFYSLARFVPAGCQLVVHDDGSLQTDDVDALQRLFPGCSVISRQLADATVNAYFAAEGLPRCRQFRDTLTFALKLFDLALFAKAPYVLMLDSDVLIYCACGEILDQLAGNRARESLYMQDVNEVYCLNRSQMSEILADACIDAFNPGIALVPAEKVDFKRLEAYLAHPGFWNPNGTGNYYAELTLWAMEMSRDGARPLPPEYAVAPGSPGLNGMKCCHYCGGVRVSYLFYTDGIPRVWRDLQQEGFLNLASNMV